MFTILTLGLPLCGIAYVLQQKRIAWLRLVLIFGLIALICVTSILLHTNLFLDSRSWWQATPWKEFSMFVLMLFGMVSSVLNAAIKNRRMEMAKARREGKATTIGLKIDKWDMFQPLLFSMITFSVLYTQVGEGSLNVGNAALSFETGFVWHTIVGRQLREPNNR